MSTSYRYKQRTGQSEKTKHVANNIKTTKNVSKVTFVSEPKSYGECTTDGFSLVHNLWDLGPGISYMYNGNYVLNETIPHTLAIHYRVHLLCNLQILSIVHKNYVRTDFWWPDKQKKREIASISFCEHGNWWTKKFMYSYSGPKLYFIGSECHWGRLEGVVLTELYEPTNFVWSWCWFGRDLHVGTNAY